MSDHRPSEKPVAIGERRISARTPVTPQAFVKFGDNNYGFVFNISETGLVFAPTGSLTLAVGASAKLRFQLPDSKEWIQANGEIVWIAQSQKEAGVRFIDLTEDTRNKIRSWISQEPSHSETPEIRNKLSEGKNSLGAEDRLSQTIAIARRSLPPDALPKDKVLSSIFADPGLFLVEAKSARVKPAAQPSAALADEPPQAASSSHIPERRSQPRRRVLSLEYLDLGDSNGGIILNISEGGMYIQAVASLSADELSDLSFRIPDSGYQIETSGKIVWVGESRKDAGIQFVNLPEEARLKLREWVAAENSAREEFRRIELPAGTRESVAEAAPSTQRNERVIATPQNDHRKAPPQPQPANPPADRVSFIDRLISKRPDSVAKTIDPGDAPPVTQNPNQYRPAASTSEKPPAIEPSAGNSPPIGNSERNVVAPAASTLATKIQEVSTAKPVAPKASPAELDNLKIAAPASSSVGAKMPATSNPSPAESSDRKIVAPVSTNGGAKTQNSSDSKLAAPAAVSAPHDRGKLPASDIFAAEPLEPAIAVQRFSDSTVAPTSSDEPEAQPSNWRRLAAVIAAIVLISFAAGWIAAGPTGRKQFLDLFVSQQSDSSPQPENPGATSAERDAPVAATHEAGPVRTDPSASASSAPAANSASTPPVTPSAAAASSSAPTLVAKNTPPPGTLANSPTNAPSNAPLGPSASSRITAPPANSSNSAGANASRDSRTSQPNSLSTNPASSRAAAENNSSKAQPLLPAPASSNATSGAAKNTSQPVTSTSAPKLAKTTSSTASTPGNSPPINGASTAPAPRADTASPKTSAATAIPKTDAPNVSSQPSATAVSSSASPNANLPAAQPPVPSDASSPASQPKPPASVEIVKGTVSVSASPFPSIRVPPELKSQISKQGASLQIGQLLSRVEPTYPEDAERQRIEGVVKLHAIIARDGSIQDIDQMSGPPLLVAAASNAVRQWRYKPTSLDGHPVEATESVTITFRLQPTHPN
jgi:TonB family protein